MAPQEQPDAIGGKLKVAPEVVQIVPYVTDVQQPVNVLISRLEVGVDVLDLKQSVQQGLGACKLPVEIPEHVFGLRVVFSKRAQPRVELGPNPGHKLGLLLVRHMSSHVGEDGQALVTSTHGTVVGLDVGLDQRNDRILYVLPVHGLDARSRV